MHRSYLLNNLMLFMEKIELSGGTMRYKIGSYVCEERDKVILKWNSWDDFGYKVFFDAQYVNEKGHIVDIGGLRIAKSSMQIGDNISSILPEEFNRIPDGFFSLWDSVDSYRKARKIMDEYGIHIFEELNDVSYDLDKLKIYRYENVFQTSFLRFTSVHTCVNQFHRISRGEAILTPYSFDYTIRNQNELVDDLKLSFNVIPQSYPPTNVHALIGSNGTGKTTLIKDMIKSICKEGALGSFTYSETPEDGYGYFESIMCISFSPFDDYSEMEIFKDVSFIGFKKHYEQGGSLLQSIENDFYESLKKCVENRAVKSDLVDTFDYLADVGEFTGQVEFFKSILEHTLLSDEDGILVRNEFKKMSAGHKVTLSILTRCIANLAEKTVVFIDEPENHLHPPLLSTLIRLLSKILNKRNGVGIVSTHSPIILQEIPKSCVWNLYRVNDSLFAERVDDETFGTNLGVLTNSVFSFEIKNTGFNSYLKEVVDNSDSFDDVMEKFDYQLGDQAKAIVRILLSRKAAKE